MTFASFDTYDGSKIFSWVSDYTGFAIDLVNFLISQALAFLLAGAMRGPLRGASPAARHTFCLVLGFITGYFCFGKKAIHLVLLPLICYFLIKRAPEKIMANSVFMTAMTYLSCIHLHRQLYLQDTCNLDITGPLMVITQRVTSIAFCLHDGREKKGDENSTAPTRDNGGHEALTKPPSFLEFLSYCLAFHTLLCGPAVPFNMYINFIYNRAPKEQTEDEFGRRKAVYGKLGGALLAASIHLALTPTYTLADISSKPVSEWSMLYLLWFCYAATLAVRCKYYLAWLLADAVCNNAGIGYRAPGQWDKISNVDIIGFETAGTFREALAKWNPGTGMWLRLAVYDRVRSGHLIKTYALSAIWHGFYPGYYLTFATGALFTQAARKVRSFALQFSWSSSKVYSALAFTMTRVFMTYATVPFVLLDLMPSLLIYRHVFFSLHWVALGALFLPSGRKSSRSPASTSSSSKSAISNGTTEHSNGTSDHSNGHTNGKTNGKVKAG